MPCGNLFHISAHPIPLLHIDTDTTKIDLLQKAYSDARSVFQTVDYYVSYRVDLLNDLRTFRTAFGY